jgi:hypothetical protein
MKQPKRIIFISNSVIPLPDARGGSIVTYRHLKRFKNDGHHIVVIYLNSFNLNGQDLSDFEYLCLGKKFWYPPIRKNTPLLTKIRMILTFNHLNSLLRFNAETDLVFGVFGEVSNLLLLKLKRRTKVPYYLFFHDDYVFNKFAANNFLTNSDAIKVLENSNYTFAVSDQLTSLLEENGISDSVTLYPIPQGYNSKQEGYEKQIIDKPSLLTSGTIGLIHFDILKKIGRASKAVDATFYCVSQLEYEYYNELSDGDVVAQPIFPDTAQLFEFITKTIDILVVFYSFSAEKEPRLLTSFPSKFIEYCHLGLPVLVIAPPESSIGKWAKQNNWISYLATDDLMQISQEITNLKDLGHWNKCRQQSLKFARGVFNPELIHNQLVAHLEISN